jgi:tRNA pseudouridine38-40 synthase
MTSSDISRVKMVVAYDGGPFRGFAENAGVPTVAGTLRAALERVLRTEVELTGAGRTDTGVHAWGQVASFDAPADGLDLARLQRSVNGLCGPAIVVRSVEVAAPDFDARFSARWRQYRYRILNRDVPDPFLAPTTWYVEPSLDLHLLTLACDPLIGEHDFSSFCRRRRGDVEQTLVRRVLDARWSIPEPDIVQFEIEATAFCHQMVRSIVGLLVEVGQGRRTPGDVMEVLRARDRSRAGQLAPPHGLCLWEVGYGE